MNLPGMNLPVDDSPIARFCALEYRVAEIDDTSPALENVIVLFLRYENGALTVFSHKDWQKIVRREDREYVRDLLHDFKERADRISGRPASTGRLVLSWAACNIRGWFQVRSEGQYRIV